MLESDRQAVYRERKKNRGMALKFQYMYMFLLILPFEKYNPTITLVANSNPLRGKQITVVKKTNNCGRV